MRTMSLRECRGPQTRRALCSTKGVEATTYLSVHTAALAPRSASLQLSGGA